MYLNLHKLCVHLNSSDTAVNDHWRYLFADWLLAEPVVPDICLRLKLVEQLPHLPDTAPFFTDKRPLPGDVGILSVYKGENGRVWLHYHDGALVEVPLAHFGRVTTARGFVTPTAMAYGRFEDITFTSLAPLLRRRGYFLVHAFAAVKQAQAVLIVGPSGSGKTTTGLNLLVHGWQLLANDILLLEGRKDGIYALPTPGGISIRPQTFTLLPAAKHLLPEKVMAVGGKVNLSGNQLIQGHWAAPSPVRIILFPHIDSRPQTTLRTQKRAVSLVRLMEESVDRWDEVTLPAHMDLLQTLSHQTAVYDLLLGREIGQLPQLIEDKLT